MHQLAARALMWIGTSVVAYFGSEMVEDLTTDEILSTDPEQAQAVMKHRRIMAAILVGAAAVVLGIILAKRR